MLNARLRASAPPPAWTKNAETPTRLIGRFFFGTSGLAALCGGGVLLTVSPAAPMALLAGVALFTLVCAVAFGFSRLPRFPVAAVLVGVAGASVVLTAAIDWTLGAGLRSPLIGFAALAICVVGAIVGLRGSLPLAALAALQIAAFGLAETRLGEGAPPVATPLALPLAFQTLVVCCSVAAGALIQRLFGHYLRAAAEREERFHTLLRIAVDWYWEQDPLFRFSQIVESHPEAGGVGTVGWHRRAIWQVPGLRIADAELDAHRADLESHLPFDGLLVQRQDESGAWRVYSLSGEPRRDRDGGFAGYWGVAREVTPELRAQRALKASEKRYRELFTRSPSPIVLHRHGVVVDANDSAARLFGFGSATEMTDFDCIALWPAGEQRERELDRLDRLERLPLGGALPVEDSQIRAIDGRLLSLQSTAVRVDTATGLANLSIFFDITARQDAEAALRRSEAMLSHLFATSPDGVAMVELPSTRFAMVNPAFCRLSGHHADEAVGRTGTELGLWEDARDAAAFFAECERNGTVGDFDSRFVAKTGHSMSVRLAAGRFRMAQRDYLVVNARDITASERTRIEHAAILQRASVGIAFTRDRRFVQANPYFVAMFRSGADLVGEPDTGVWPEADDGGTIGELAAAALARGEAFRIERDIRRADGSRFACRLVAQAVDPADAVGSGTIWIAEDVTEQRRLDQALASARDAAEAANLAKSAFLANTNHEIRTPLNGLLGLAQLALEPDIPEAQRREYLAQILDSARGLAGVMSDILDVSKIEAGQIALDDIAFTVRDLLHAVQQGHRQLAETKGVDLRFEVDPALPRTLRGDPVRLRQILANLVGNALKFTAHGSVTVCAGPTPAGEVRIAVADTGPGIDAATQARLFTPFGQGDASTTRRYGGTGLGLAICRELAQLMGGRVGVVSQRGAGSTFWAELPLAAAAEPPVPLPERDDADTALLAGRRVLVVEDNPVNMMIVVAMLERWGLAVAQAPDGRAAVDAVHEAARQDKAYDAVLMDVQMPVMSGHEATRQLRRHFAPEVLPIVALTAAALVSEREEALRAGMNDFLTKPIDLGRLRQTLLRALAPRG